MQVIYHRHHINALWKEFAYSRLEPMTNQTIPQTVFKLNNGPVEVNNTHVKTIPRSNPLDPLASKLVEGLKQISKEIFHVQKHKKKATKACSLGMNRA